MIGRHRTWRLRYSGTRYVYIATCSYVLVHTCRKLRRILENADDGEEQARVARETDREIEREGETERRGGMRAQRAVCRSIYMRLHSTRTSLVCQAQVEPHLHAARLTVQAERDLCDD